MTDSIPHHLDFGIPLPDTPQVRGFQEVLFSVSDLEEATAFYQKNMGWEVLYTGTDDRRQCDFWSLAPEATMREVLLRNPGNRTGFLRLVQFSGVPQEQIRSSARPWDTGGIFDINLRAVDLAASFREFQNEGWNGFSDPIRYQFGRFDVEEVVMQGPDGIAIAMMQRYAPPLEGYPHLRKLSHIFNATHVSRDVQAAEDFFIRQLGFQTYFQTTSVDRKAGPNVLGIPQNINDDIELPVYIVHPEKTNLGSVEFIQMKGLEGKDVSAKAIPPNLGILMLRFPVSNAAAYAKQLRTRGVELHLPLSEIELAPYGKLRIFAVRSPDGVWLEFIEKINS